MAEGIEITIAAVGAAAAFVGALYALVKYKGAIQNWFSKRRKRRETLDRLIENAETMKCTECNINELRERVDKNAKDIGDLTEILSDTIEHNQRQDKEIEKSLKQRELIYASLFAIMDTQKQAGIENDALNLAHREMEEFLRKEAHRPMAGITKRKKRGDL